MSNQLVGKILATNFGGRIPIDQFSLYDSSRLGEGWLDGLNS